MVSLFYGAGIRLTASTVSRNYWPWPSADAQLKAARIRSLIR